MNQKHVPSIELCQQFVDLCSKNNITIPETEYQWQIGGKLSGETTATLVPTNRPPTYGSADSAWRFLPAPLVSEQGEWLPLLSGYDLIASCEHRGGNWVSFYMAKRMGENDFPMGKDLCKSETEPNARQKMINYLIAEGIVTVL